MKRRQLVLSGVLTVLSGVAGCTEDDGEPVAEPAEVPALLDRSALDVNEVYDAALEELVSAPLTTEATLTVVDAGLVSDRTVEQQLHQVTLDGDTETGVHLTAWEPGEIDDPYAAREVEERYHADGFTFRFRDVGSEPTYRGEQAPFDEFVATTDSEATPLVEYAEQISFDEPAWDDDAGVYVVRGTAIDDGALDDEWAFSHATIQLDEIGSFGRASAELAVEEYEVTVEIEVVPFEDETIPRPDWVPADPRHVTIEIGVDDGTVLFSYDDGAVVSRDRLVLPANSFVEFRMPGDYEYSDTLGVTELRLKLDLEPDEERSQELFVSAGHIGSYRGESFMLTGVDIAFDVDVVAADEFDEWFESNA